ncbi:MAG: SDR family oxidoreductase [Candidatus Rokubacteria bacterium]|nr:SDR family oxidoreductase [Candidatus Rokubacteria bacterium]
MTVSLAAHLVDHGIRVNAIAPCTIDTEFATGVLDPAVRQALLEKRVRERIPMKRLGQPQDLVGAALFLCSDESAYVTGHILSRGRRDIAAVRSARLVNDGRLGTRGDRGERTDGP